jgi:hypothetical protein
MPRRCGASQPESGLRVSRLPRSQGQVWISELVLPGWDECPHAVDWKPYEPTEAAQLVDRRIDLPVAPGVVQSFEDFLAGEN